MWQDLHLDCRGSAPYRIILGGQSTLQEVYFVLSARNFYLLHDVCKGFSLIPESFANHNSIVVRLEVGQVMSLSEVALPLRSLALPFQPVEENEWLLCHF